jgi:NTP pyrophosphatase (non-canonical NTP hydrolase)
MSEQQSSAESEQTSFQKRVHGWMMDCFSMEICRDRQERNHRFLEEALELVQACGCTTSEAHQLVDYVYGRDQGDINQEVGGVMVTLAALCLANDIDMHQGGETELARILQPAIMNKIRAKQAAKPKHSPLPAHPAPGAEPQTVSKLEAEIGMLREKLSDALASGLPHKSDCAVYSAPAHEPGPCDCGVGASFDDGAFDLALKLRQHNGWVRVVSDTDAVNLIKSFIASRCQADSSPQSAPSDDLEDLVARFSKALLAKLKLARANGRSGWEFDDWEEHCQAGLLRHLAKGDPRDVAAYCAFMWHHGWATKAADRQSQAESAALTQSERKS